MEYGIYDSKTIAITAIYIIHKFFKINIMQNKRTDRLDAEERKQLRSSDFGLPQQREFPMPDATHVRAAEAYFRYAAEDSKPELAHRILLKAKKFKVNVKSEIILDWARKYKS